MHVTSKMTDKEVVHIVYEYEVTPQCRTIQPRNHNYWYILRLPDSFIIQAPNSRVHGGHRPALLALRMFFLIASEIDSVRSRIVVVQ